jgi:DNA mismatch repair protein MutL
MPVIRQLPPAVVNKIAAGEVIERPASVVKELLENSVDAGASRVEVSMTGGGLESIRVADNGCGMSADQLHLAVASHATSKIESADDLFHVATLGFRGEALASIAEVSHFLVRSRTAGEPAGAQLRVNGGARAELEPCGCDVGTTIEVRDLFFNTPVRRKFLRAAATEVSYCTEAFTRICLAYPAVRFVLKNNERLLFDLPPAVNWAERIATLLGREVGASLIPVDGEEAGIRISGYVADPNFSRGNNRWQYLFLNGRCIRDRSLQHALTEAYRGLLMTGRFPVAFLRLEMPVELVDVNVHPTKMEVRFQDAGRIYSQILGTVRRKFLSSDLTARVRSAQTQAVANGSAGAGSDPIGGHPRTSGTEFTSPVVATGSLAGSANGPIATTGARETAARLPIGAEDRQQHRQDLLDWARGRGAAAADRPTAKPSAGAAPWDVDDRRQTSAPPVEAQDSRGGQGPAPTGTEIRLDAAQPALRPPAGLQLHQRYLVTEDELGILIIDQHALHERILYEQLRAKVESGRMETQRLLVPEPVNLSGAELAVVLESIDALAEVGIGVEPFGGDSLLIRSYPAMLSRVRPADLLRQIVDLLVEGKRSLEKRDMLEEILNMVACKAAVKAGDSLAADEVAALLSQRHLFRDTHHCPHGRPTALAFSREELDRRFKRI